jgi:hypothetical protein
LRSRAARESRRSSSGLSAMVVAFILESAMKVKLVDSHAWSRQTVDRHTETAGAPLPLDLRRPGPRSLLVRAANDVMCHFRT